MQHLSQLPPDLLHNLPCGQEAGTEASKHTNLCVALPASSWVEALPRHLSGTKLLLIALSYKRARVAVLVHAASITSKSDSPQSVFICQHPQPKKQSACMPCEIPSGKQRRPKKPNLAHQCTQTWLLRQRNDRISCWAFQTQLKEVQRTAVVEPTNPFAVARLMLLR